MFHVKVFTFNPVQENTYVLYNEDHQAIIIDPGCYFPAEQERLKQFIEVEKLNPSLLLNTHCHLDHVFGNQWVSDTWNLPLHLHKDEQAMLAAAPISGKQWGLPFEAYQGPMKFIDESDQLILGKDQLSVFLTPGHSPASLCFYSEADQFVIGGDVLFREGIGRFDLPGGSFEVLLTSIREKLLVLPDAVRVYPGHGDHTTIAHEKMHNPYLSNGD